MIATALTARDLDRLRDAYRTFARAHATYLRSFDRGKDIERLGCVALDAQLSLVAVMFDVDVGDLTDVFSQDELDALLP